MRMKYSLFFIALISISLVFATVADDDRDGVPDANDICPDSVSDIVDSSGCDCTQKSCGGDEVCVEYNFYATCMLDSEYVSIGDDETDDNDSISDNIDIYPETAEVDYEVCDGLDNDQDGNIDMVGGVPLQYTKDHRLYICENGQWIDRGTCRATEDCSNEIDDDCDGNLPADDTDCVRRVWTKPVAKSKWKKDCTWYGDCDCDAAAWNQPDDYYNPAKHKVNGMNIDEWRCAVDNTYYPGSLPYFLGKGIGQREIGLIWFVRDIVDSFSRWIRGIIVSIVEEILKLAYPESKGEIGRLGSYVDELTKPDAVVYGWAGLCIDFDAKYSLKRDWVCYHNSYSTDEIFDWRSKDGVNWMTPVRNQNNPRSCGSCWAFSALGAVEGMNNIKNNDAELDINLAEQELVSCSDAGTCAGGSARYGVYYVNGEGIVMENCFPYQGRDASCAPTCETRHRIGGYELVEPEREALKLALTEGPVSVCMDLAGAIQFDNNGIGRCDGRTGNGGHCVTLVGYNDISGYWIIKNSWGTGWYESGYGKIGYGECNLESNRGTPTAVK